MDEDANFRRVLFPTQKQITAARKRDICYELGYLKERQGYNFTWEEIAKRADIKTGGEAKKHYLDACEILKREGEKSDKQREEEELAHNKRMFNWLIWKRWFDQN